VLYGSAFAGDLELGYAGTLTNAAGGASLLDAVQSLAQLGEERSGASAAFDCAAAPLRTHNNTTNIAMLLQICVLEQSRLVGVAIRREAHASRRLVNAPFGDSRGSSKRVEWQLRS
jgi:hypothetical protein